MKHIIEFEKLFEDKTDDILDKISKSGMDSLTPQEKEYLDSLNKKSNKKYNSIYDFENGKTYYSKSGESVKINTITDTHVSFILNNSMQDRLKYNSFLSFMNGETEHDILNF